MIVQFLLSLVSVALTAAQESAVFPEANQDVATKISCLDNEVQHFVYASDTELWGIMGGRISLSADVALLCLGDDSDGSYGPDALKYRVDVTNLQLKEVKDRPEHAMLRQKRGAREFLSSQWKKVKDFFKRVFGRKNSDDRSRARSTPDPRGERKDEEEELEDLDAAEFSPLYSEPFQFVQLSDGSVPELRFSERERDPRVKNFKRHLVDAFATKLDFNANRRHSVVEKSVIGEHHSTYNVTVNGGGLAHLNAEGGESSPSGAGASGGGTVVVEKRVTAADLIALAPSPALNDRDKMDLRLEQVQVFREGRMLSSSGTHSLVLLPKTGQKDRRIKREGGVDITSFMQSETTFDIQLQKRTRRSAHRSARNAHERNEAFHPAGRVAEPDGSPKRERTGFLTNSPAEIEAIFESLIKSREEDYDEKLQSLFESVEGEVRMNLEKDENSVSATAKRYFTKQLLHDLCDKNFSTCKDFLQLLAFVGGPEVEEVFLFFLTEEHSLTSMEIQIIADLISDVSHPSSDFTHTVSSHLEGTSLNKQIRGTLAISLGHLASKSTVEDSNNISRTFATLLKNSLSDCVGDTFAIDILEAIGNMKNSLIVPDVFGVSASCRENSIVQTACIHALRHSTDREAVQRWISDKIATGDCDVLQEVVGALLDKIQDQAVTPGDRGWPRFGFNGIDRQLMALLNGSSSSCHYEDVLRYFRRKSDPVSNELARTHFAAGSAPADPFPVGGGQRQKRAALWDDFECGRWSGEGPFAAIQSGEEFAADRAAYNHRRSCLGFKKLGVKGANAHIYAGMFAGVKEPSDPPKYKLFTKFVSQLNFLGQQMEIGSFRFYHQNGKMNTYVKILGRTRQEFSHEGCTPTDLMYRPLRQLPLFLVNVGIAQLSLGVQISSQLGMSTACPEGEAYQLQPLASVRVGGEATGTVLFIRGGVNLGGNFNYKLQLSFSPSPNMCLTGSHGYDPMNIGFETYYQLWNRVKDDWGKMRTWRPGFVTWNLTRGEVRPWFEDACILRGRTGAASTEREVE